MSKKKILQLGKFYYPVKGGMEDHLYHLCNRLKDKFDVQVVVANTECSTRFDTINGVSVARVANFGELFSNSLCPTMPLSIRKFDADIVHIHLPNPMAHLSYLLAKPKGKLIIMWHSDIIKQRIFLRLYKLFLMRFLKNADRIIATSEAYMFNSKFLSKFKEKCEIIPLGIEPERFKSTEMIKSKVNDIKKNVGDKIVLFVGRLIYYKGLEYLITAMKTVDAALLIVGEGPLEKRLKQLAANSKANNKVYFLKGISNQEIVSYFHACDIFVLPSIERSEAFGVVQLEAMACCKPVVSTDLRTGVPWVNQSGITGIVVPPRDSESLASAINTLLADPELCKKYGENGRKRVEKEFNMDLMAERIHCLYQEIL